MFEGKFFDSTLSLHKIPDSRRGRKYSFLILALDVEEGGGALLVAGLAGNHATVLPEVAHGGRVDRQRAILADRRPPLEILRTNFPSRSNATIYSYF